MYVEHQLPVWIRVEIFRVVRIHKAIFASSSAIVAVLIALLGRPANCVVLQNFRSKFCALSDSLTTPQDLLSACDVGVPTPDRLVIAMSKAGRPLPFLLDFIIEIGVLLLLAHPIEIQDVASVVQPESALFWQVKRLALHR